MSFVLISPEVVSAAAGDLAKVGSTISAANKAAAAATTQVLAAGADEVSARIAALFGMYGLEYQAISAQVAAYHQQFVQTLRTGAASYMLAEATNVEQNLLNLINAPTQTLLGRPLIGDGANATTPSGPAETAGCCLAAAATARPVHPARLAVPVGLPGYWATAGAAEPAGRARPAETAAMPVGYTAAAESAAPGESAAEQAGPAGTRGCSATGEPAVSVAGPAATAGGCSATAATAASAVTVTAVLAAATAATAGIPGGSWAQPGVAATVAPAAPVLQVAALGAPAATAGPAGVAAC